MSSCHNYLHSCGVECCDESVQCVFSVTSTNATGHVSLLQSGYVEEEGPSAKCTGAAGRSAASPLIVLLGIIGLHSVMESSFSGPAQVSTERSPGRRGIAGRSFVMAMLVLSMVMLQGCQMVIPRHQVGNWRAKPNYLNEYKYVAKGKPASEGTLNSCNIPSLPPTLQCNGRGYCKAFSESSIAVQQSSTPPLAFCQCESDWADPECGTKRKSQRWAFFWSVSFGYLGADYFYLGYPLWGLGKLLTLGGCGTWWLIDIVRTGAGPVYAQNFRVSNDLPHWLAIVIMVFLCMFSGFFIAIVNHLFQRRQKRDGQMRELASEEARKWKHPQTENELNELAGPRRALAPRGLVNYEGRPGFTGYGATLPLPLSDVKNAIYATGERTAAYGQTPGTVVQCPSQEQQTFGPAGIPNMGSPTPKALQGLVSPTHIPNMGREQGRFARQNDFPLTEERAPQ